MTTLKGMCRDREYVYTYEEQEKAWEKVASMTLYHNDAMVDRWNKEIDTYLVFVSDTRHDLPGVTTHELMM